jgi:CelD/BcsL family acetyltransferase involved in cellulose biosynthesis
MLRVTTLLIGGEVAAIDMGAVWRNTYAVLAGGTRSEFPGVAKLINLHHLEWSCRQRFSYVDFLCGDFNWKNRFHLTPRPLYQMKKEQPEVYRQPAAADLEVAYAV